MQNRRNFIQKFLFAVASLFTLPLLGNTNQKNKNMENSIKKIKALGFQWETLDPFLFCVHHEDKFPKGNENMEPDVSLKGRHLGDDFIIKDGWRMYHGKKVPGFPGHPHKGFETITVVREGWVDHADSLGAAGRYGNGDVQWMTAGKGIQHSEMFPLVHQDKENPMELFQIWLNLPSKSKNVEPHFKMMWGEKIPKITYKDLQNRETKIEVIVGNLLNTKANTPPPNSWAANPQNEVAVWNIKLQPNSEFVLPKASKGINRTLYFYEGDEILIDNVTINRYHSVEVLSHVDLKINNKNHPSSILVLQGKPINEPVIQYGPFVMNTKEEIHQAFDDFNKTQFGGWPWARYDQVHDKTVGRFAKHADGKIEKM